MRKFGRNRSKNQSEEELWYLASFIECYWCEQTGDEAVGDVGEVCSTRGTVTVRTALHLASSADCKFFLREYCV